MDIFLCKGLQYIDKIKDKTNTCVKVFNNDLKKRLLCMTIYNESDESDEYDNIYCDQHLLFIECQLENINIKEYCYDNNSLSFSVEYTFNIINIIKNKLFTQLKETDKYIFCDYINIDKDKEKDKDENQTIDLINTLLTHDFPINDIFGGEYQRYNMNFFIVPEKDNNDYQILKHKIMHSELYIFVDEYFSFFDSYKNNEFFKYYLLNVFKNILSKILVKNIIKNINKNKFNENEWRKNVNICSKVDEFSEIVMKNKKNKIFMENIGMRLIEYFCEK